MKFTTKRHKVAKAHRHKGKAEIRESEYQGVRKRRIFYLYLRVRKRLNKKGVMNIYPRFLLKLFAVRALIRPVGEGPNNQFHTVFIEEKEYVED
jgi:hypothetical protein